MNKPQQFDALVACLCEAGHPPDVLKITSDRGDVKWNESNSVPEAIWNKASVMVGLRPSGVGDILQFWMNFDPPVPGITECITTKGRP